MAEAAPDANEPEVVYHYTSMDTMIKIVESATIWATSISYLNDDSEREHQLKLIRERIRVYQQTHSLANKNIFDDVLNEDDLGFDSRPFVASFSQEDDALPQWRSYCPQGNGVAIGFRVDCLKRSVLSEEDSDDDNLALGGSRKALGLTPRILFRRIDYLDASRVQSLDDDIKTAIAESLQNEEEDRISYEGGVTYVQPASLYFKVIIEGRASFKKHPSFFAEREYRLLVDGSFFQAHLFKFRTTRSTLVPFMSVKIPLREWRHPEKPFIRPVGEGRWDFIDREVIGPTTNKGLSLDAVSAFFVKNRMDVEVVSSTIPYRDWQTVQSAFRNISVIALAKVRAGFRCEIPGCTSSTFIGEYGHPYCEVHHIEWLSEGGADTPENVASLCPMHHREIHFGKGRQKLTDDLLRLRANEHTPILQIIKQLLNA